jgi:hypothetical protein
MYVTDKFSYVIASLSRNNGHKRIQLVPYRAFRNVWIDLLVRRLDQAYSDISQASVTNSDIYTVRDHKPK